MTHAHSRRGRIGLALIALLTGACAPHPLAANVANAATATSLPAVSACWEKELESAKFHGSYVATVNFTIVAITSQIRDAEVTKLESSLPERSGTAFRACLEAALDHSSLPTQTIGDTPGFSSRSDLAVRRFRFVFSDSAEQNRRAASEHNVNVIVGPRADRCQGLYSHEPPRDASILFEQAATAEAQAAAFARRNEDERARQLQTAYDAELELRARLLLDVEAPGLPEANRAKLRKEARTAEDAARRLGAQIGCSPSETR